MAKTFLEATDTFYKIASSNTSVFGSGAKQQISLASDITNIIIDSNVEGVQLQGNQADYQFLQQGNTLKILQNNVLVTRLSVQDDDDGSQLAFADKTVNATFAFDIAKGGLHFDVGGVFVSTTPVTISNSTVPEIPIVETPQNNPVKTPTLLEIPTSTLNYEASAPFIYQSDNLQNLDSITALLSYSPMPQNGVDYSNTQTLQWRTRASSEELAIDLTQTAIPTNQVVLQGQLDTNTNAQTWYKIQLTQPSNLQIQDLSTQNALIGVAIFPDDGGQSGLRYSYSVSNPQLHNYKDVPAGNYFVRIDKEASAATTEMLDFNVSISTQNANVLKADLTKAKPAISTDTAGNLELTYTFDLSKILGTDDAQPNATVFSEAQKQAARSALQAYENIAKVKFRELPAGSSENAQLTFTNVSSLGSAAGEASTQQSNTGDYSRVTIRVDVSKTDASAGFAVGTNDYATLLHEIGHALGLKHPRSYGSAGADSELPFLTTEKDNNQYTIMSYNRPTYLIQDGYDLNTNVGAVAEKTPLLYDIAAIQKLYGTNQNYNSGDTVYRWEKDTDPHTSIWDSGGIDTIDASNQTQKQELDLRAGKFGSIGAITLRYTDGSTDLYAPQNNVSIAFGTIIENAIGSNQNDVIISNSVANQLTGNGGRDSFVFASTLSDFNVDTITDFNTAEDALILERTIFNALNKSDVLTAQELFISSVENRAENTAQRLIFNTATQGLYYDADGLGGENALLFALLPNVTTLNASQIFIQG